MGRASDTLTAYLKDSSRFAALFNGGSNWSDDEDGTRSIGKCQRRRTGEYVYSISKKRCNYSISSTILSYHKINLHKKQLQYR